MAEHRITSELAEVIIRFKRNGEWHEFSGMANDIIFDHEVEYDDIIVDDKYCYNRFVGKDRLTIKANIQRIDGRYGRITKI